MSKLTFLLILASLFSTFPLIAQDETSSDDRVISEESVTQTNPPINPELVFIEAADSQILGADFYLINPGHPTVILIHQLYNNRNGWLPLTTPLLQAGFNVLAVDLRGHGSTRGGINWTQSVEDVQLWFNWLREMGVRGNAISTVGSSIGSTMAIVSCANDPHCRTTVAFSPGRNYYDVSIESALHEGLANRSTLILYTARDRFPAIDMPTIMDVARGELVVHEYPGNAHGFNFIQNELDTVVPIVVEWLMAHGS